MSVVQPFWGQEEDRGARGSEAECTESQGCVSDHGSDQRLGPCVVTKIYRMTKGL